jgi:CRP-like cAMP-binding protein
VTARSFLDELDEEARSLLLSVASPVSYVPGSVLVRHGETARGAHILREGTVQALITLPGGESMTVATMGPGSVFGEMALIELGTATATIRATAPVDGWFVAHEDFRAVVSQSRPAALRLQHAVTVILAAKVAALNAQLLGIAAPEDRAARPTRPGIDPLAGVMRARRASFDARPFLQRLPLFERCIDGRGRGQALRRDRRHGQYREAHRGRRRRRRDPALRRVSRRRRPE